MTSLLQNNEILPTDMTTAKSKSSDAKASITNMAVNNHVEKRFDNIIKSPNDKRLYRGLLLTNKMKVLLISEPTTDKSAASLIVNTGYFFDPDDLPGLAHFCEHMLFLGTQKYPQQNEYTMYLSQNGGTYNASTHVEHTTYFFDVDSEKLEGALDRFAQFFLTPLFTETLTELELNAINLEHEKNLANDTWRINQLDKSSAKPDHPYSKFGTGNKQTLDVLPKQNGVNVREKLLEFHEKYYSANTMSLCVLGKESLDELEQMVANMFSEVRNKEVELPVWEKPPFDEEHFQNKWYIVPIKDLRNLTMIFPIPDLQQYYKSAPAHYIAHLLGHEGEGSLLSALKARGWCNSLLSSKRLGARGFEFFNIVVDLTKEGVDHVDDIILLTFQYINMLKKEGPIKWIHDEYKDIADMNFRFKEKCPPYRYVSSIVQVLQDYPMEEVLTIEQLFPEWKPDLINWVMDHLTPQNVRIHVVGKSYENIADETEKWYGTKFKKEKIPQSVIEKWSNPGYSSDLKLPPKNDFIPTKFDIKPAEGNITKFPEIINNTPLIRLWFKQDDEFLVPKANLSVDFVSPVTYMDPLSFNCSYLFTLLFRDSLNEYAYAAELAGLKWELSNNKYGMTIGIGGYDDKQRVLLEKIMDKMVSFKVDPKRFEVLKEAYVRGLKNFEVEQPYQHAVYYLSALLSEQVWLKDELLKATSQLTAERVQQFIPQFLSKVHVECLLHGNVTMLEAMETAKLIESKLTSTLPYMVPLLPRQLILYREIKLENGSHFVFEVENKSHNSSCIEVYYQTSLQSTESNMHLELLAQILSEPCFSTLRTKEQLGYIVFSGIHRTNGAQGLRIIVQSDRHPQYLEQRINLFLESMLEHVSNMSEEEFNRHKESLAVQRLEKPKKLTNLTMLFWYEISMQQYNFDRANIEVAYLRTITKEQIIKFYKEIIKTETQQKLSVHVISTTEDSKAMKESATLSECSDATNANGYKRINDIMTFKISQSLFPLLKPFNDVPRKGAHSSKL